MSVCVYMHANACYSACMEVRGQLVGIRSPITWDGGGFELGFSYRHCYLLSHLLSPRN